MKILFIHQNFPGQYKHLAPHMRRLGHEVMCLGDQATLQPVEPVPGLAIMGYPSPASAGSATHHYLTGFESAIRRGQAVVRNCLSLRELGFVPDVICAHPAWGEALFVKDVFPTAKLLILAEYYYRSSGSDVGFDPEFPPGMDDLFRLRIRNSVMLHALQAMDWGVVPTAWQLAQIPQPFRQRISRIHEGVDTNLIRPNPDASIFLARDGITLRPGDEVITFVNRNLEPYRGFHTFMRALPEMMARRPNARFIILGGDDVSYGKRLEGETYRQRYLEEVRGRIDISRVHFLGKLSYQAYLAVLQVSAVHVYLTYPFILSWSMLEAMAAGCAIVGSTTSPVKEVIRDGETGLLVDFFDPAAVAAAVDRLLVDRVLACTLGRRARALVRRRYDLHRYCLPRYQRLIEDLAAGIL